MNRVEFLTELSGLLQDISQEEREEALQYYADYFDEAGPEREQDCIVELGSPAKVAAQIREGLGGDLDAGEFTERGYHDARFEEAQHVPDQYAKIVPGQQAGAHGQNGDKAGADGGAYGNGAGAYGGRTGTDSGSGAGADSGSGAGAYGNRTYDGRKARNGACAYYGDGTGYGTGTQDSGSEAYTGDVEDSDAYGRAESGKERWSREARRIYREGRRMYEDGRRAYERRRTSYHESEAGRQTDGTARGRRSGSAYAYAEDPQRERQRRRRTGILLVLLMIFCGFPVARLIGGFFSFAGGIIGAIFGLIGGLFGLVFGIIGGLFGIVFTAFAAAFGLVVSGIGLIVSGFGNLITPGIALMEIGAGFFSLVGAIFVFLAAKWGFTTVIPAAFHLGIDLIKQIFGWIGGLIGKLFGRGDEER